MECGRERAADASFCHRCGSLAAPFLLVPEGRWTRAAIGIAALGVVLLVAGMGMIATAPHAPACPLVPSGAGVAPCMAEDDLGQARGGLVAVGLGQAGLAGAMALTVPRAGRRKRP